MCVYTLYFDGVPVFVGLKLLLMSAAFVNPARFFDYCGLRGSVKTPDETVLFLFCGFKCRVDLCLDF